MAIEDLYQLLDCVPTPIFVLDVLEGAVPVYGTYNAAALARLGRPLSDFVGRTTIEAFGAEYGAAAYREQLETIRTRTRRSYEFKLPFGDETRIVRTTLAPQMTPEGEVIRLIGSAKDVSAEWAAANAQAKLRSIGDEVEQFVTMAAHDLRTPMRNVAMLSEMLREDFEDRGDGKLELIEMLAETSEKSMALISDVLSHASAVGAVAEDQTFELAQLVRNIMGALDPQSIHKMICDDATVTGDKNAVQIVLRNLIDNALKYGGRERMQLTCRARCLEGGFIEFTVGDNGKGFDNPGSVFLQTGDFRVDSGYGLLGIRRLILARGGSIRVFNNSDRAGSSVCFCLPGHTDASQLPMAAAPAPVRPAILPVSTPLIK
ncbi:HAMP domain-containing sensor histidine kinase [Sulfitobacter sp. S190]|uniref:sensor histidine kinase n=1 Tax=Sulfitobacter sp. S190 TaxID=2867022 RepID=UPI0021A70CB2|nr:PAS domain-containing sensor histidine kinase [Sulfitobacter sp. S190]UWR23724.1 PAS domain-containing sensor histidine kinase [Sulfitobacter sp. S190]